MSSRARGPSRFNTSRVWIEDGRLKIEDWKRISHPRLLMFNPPSAPAEGGEVFVDAALRRHPL
jgi:hypothetical protein